MKYLQRQVLLGGLLIVVSAGLYFLQIRLFHAERDTFFYLFQDLAFVPIQVLLVTVIVDQVLRIREKLAMMNKLNMVIGTFFSEAGTRLLTLFAAMDLHAGEMRNAFAVSAQWSDRQFADAMRSAAGRDIRIDSATADMQTLKDFLLSKREFLLRLLANPNLLEHETFTELLWAVFHLTEELSLREDVGRLEGADREHIGGDIKRAYGLLVMEWLAYLKHLKSDYPYLYSLAVRRNPFDPAASVEILQ